MDSPVATRGAVGLSHTGADELLTPSQAGDYLQTGERFIRRLIAERRIEYIKLGRYVRVQRSVLDAFIEAGRVPRAPGTLTGRARAHGRR
ncbi:helix-turn-helix domain-containing protein [Geodermatophilus marinus]|uniref:helix-turn-helix domain-containing protein n=1 Tax=Geodermatophilus sp. LHW52908 TaxID=2303986 RepID=UPI000E3C1D01|nr:helix-turn-helix domain-containing protein [Geodermatophilus sp. LHW52908]RFU18775.1 DNA-binding protein [Geodermatophilus sp. LHW52908]